MEVELLKVRKLLKVGRLIDIEERCYHIKCDGQSFLLDTIKDPFSRATYSVLYPDPPGNVKERRRSWLLSGEESSLMPVWRKRHRTLEKALADSTERVRRWVQR